MTTASSFYQEHSSFVFLLLYCCCHSLSLAGCSRTRHLVLYLSEESLPRSWSTSSTSITQPQRTEHHRDPLSRVSRLMMMFVVVVAAAVGFLSDSLSFRIEPYVLQEAGHARPRSPRCVLCLAHHTHRARPLARQNLPRCKLCTDMQPNAIIWFLSP